MEEPDIFEFRSYRKGRRRRRFFTPLIQANLDSIKDLENKLRATEDECRRRQDILRDARSKIATLKCTISTLRTRLSYLNNQKQVLVQRIPPHIADRIWDTKKQDLECSTCYQSITSREEYVLTSCGHEFCNKCISKWIAKNKSCPVCREIIRDP